MIGSPRIIKHRRHSDPQLPDLLGNLPLHHAFARANSDTEKIRILIAEYPAAGRLPNQFGRIPLHYAVDHLRVNQDALRLLLATHPDGPGVIASDGMSPYDISVKWGHKNEILRMLLQAYPSLDPKAATILKYGPLANIYFWWKKRNKRDSPVGSGVAEDGLSLPEEDGDSDGDGEHDTIEMQENNNTNSSTNKNINKNEDDLDYTSCGKD